MSSRYLSRQLHLWFEFASTYSYLTVSRIEGLLQGTPVQLVWHPFLLGPLFRDRGLETSPFVADPVKGAYMWRDMARRAAQLDLPFARPAIFPANSLTAARIMTAASGEAWSGAFARGVFAAQFQNGADISEDATLAAVLADCDVSPETWLAKAQTPEVKAALRAQTDQARALGIFGAPSMVVGDELFWGDDRLEDAIAFALQ